MKFELHAKEFKNAVERAMTVLDKKSPLPVLDNIKIVSGDGVITITASNLETSVDVVAGAKIIESGEVYIDKANLVKVYGLSDVITVESNEKVFNVKNQKKCCEVPVSNFNAKDYPITPVIDENVNCLFETSEKDLISTFIAMNCFRADNNTSKKILSGYNIDGAKERIAATDAYRLVVKNIKGEFHDNNFNITLPADSCLNLKKIGNTKREDNISVYYGKPSNCSAYFAFIKGIDYTYCCRVLDGDYINYSHILEDNKAYSFEFSPKELENIAKEYSKEKGVPMYIIRNEDKLYTSVVSSSYQTADALENVENLEMKEDFCFCVNSSFLKDAMSLFSDDKITAYGNDKTLSSGSISSSIFFQNDEYTALVLPVRAEAEVIESRREFIKKIKR